MDADPLEDAVLDDSSSDDELMEATDDEWIFSDWYGQAAPQEIARGQRESVLGVELVEDDAYIRPTMSVITAALSERVDPLRRNLSDPSRNKRCNGDTEHSEGRRLQADDVRVIAYTAISSSSPGAAARKSPDYGFATGRSQQSGAGTKDDHGLQSSGGDGDS